MRRLRIDPISLGFPHADMAELAGGDASWNAEVIRRVLEGERGARRDIGVLNAAAALVVAGRASDLERGAGLASESIDGGRAAQVLADLVRVSGEAAEAPGASIC